MRRKLCTIMKAPSGGPGQVRPQRRRRRSGLLLGGSGAAASIMVRIVCVHRPPPEPAPQAFATCLVERAPASMACWTVVVVTPTQRQMYISSRGQHDGLDQASDEQRRGWAPPRLGHEGSRGVGVADPLLRLAFGGDLLQDHHLGLVVESAIDPEA